MIGDGVNDVLSLKKANMGIAMESGSTATRSVAAMILLGDSFAAMPDALSEGQRIVSSIQAILKLFMVTVFALLLLVIGVTILNLGFPFTALQNTLLSFFARGAPPFILGLTVAAAAKRTTLNHNILHFTLPASFMLFLFGLLIYMGAFFLVEQGIAEITVTPEMISTMEKTASVDAGTMTTEQFYQSAILFSAQTALTTFFVFTGITLMLFASPPGKWWAGGSTYEGRNWLVVAGAILLYIGYIIVLAVPALRAFFQLMPLPIAFHVAIATLTVLWVFVQRFLWRSNWLERFLDVDVETDAVTA
jgi:cation-transporting ATPase E